MYVLLNETGLIKIRNIHHPTISHIFIYTIQCIPIPILLLHIV